MVFVYLPFDEHTVLQVSFVKGYEVREALISWLLWLISRLFRKLQSKEVQVVIKLSPSKRFRLHYMLKNFI